MTAPTPRRVLVIHTGALGDCVMVWPLVRALARAGANVTFAARASHARLTARCIDPDRITPADTDAPEYTRLWSADAPASPSTEPFDTAFTFLTDDSTPAGRTWLASAAARWPDAAIVTVGPPESPSRDQAWEDANVADLGHVHARANPPPDGPVVLHVGAGSPTKRWPLDRFLVLAEELRRSTPTAPLLIAGEVEAERFTPTERDHFTAAGGRFLPDLDTLAAELSAAALVIGNDSGPAHLGAQLGVPVLALFGPTDPRVWAPVGPLVGVLAPTPPGPIDVITVDAVVSAATNLLGAAGAFDPGDNKRATN